MARILAKALECPQVVDAEPCNQCEVCEAIGQGEDLDVIEIDGASNRGIDDIRGIRDSAGFVPARSPFKIFIIDEVHMLTIQAFNALLKVLEEPPAHVRFIFATTDPASLPDTILSRCQRHEFRRIGIEDIVGRLADICQRESIEASDEVLRAIASKSEGGLRDSVSLLDQVVSYAGNTLGVKDLEGAVGLLPQERLHGLLESLAAGDSSAALKDLDEAFWAGFDPMELLAQMTSLLRDMMLWSADESRVTDTGRRALFAECKDRLNIDRIIYLLKLLLNTRGDIKRSGHERVQIELAMLKAARSVDMVPVKEILARLDGKELPAQTAPATAQPLTKTRQEPLRAPAPPTRPASTVSMGVDSSESQDQAAEPPVPEELPTKTSAKPLPVAAPTTPVNLDLVKRQWRQVCDALRSESVMLGSTLAQSLPIQLTDDRLTLQVAHGQQFLVDQLTESAASAPIRRALKTAFGKTLGYRVVLSSVKAGESNDAGDVHDDPSVRKFMEHFDGGVTDVEKSDG